MYHKKLWISSINIRIIFRYAVIIDKMKYCFCRRCEDKLTNCDNGLEWPTGPGGFCYKFYNIDDEKRDWQSAKCAHHVFSNSFY